MNVKKTILFSFLAVFLSGTLGYLLYELSCKDLEVTSYIFENIDDDFANCVDVLGTSVQDGQDGQETLECDYESEMPCSCGCQKIHVSKCETLVIEEPFSQEKESEKVDVVQNDVSETEEAIAIEMEDTPIELVSEEVVQKEITEQNETLVLDNDDSLEFSQVDPIEKRESQPVEAEVDFGEELQYLIDFVSEVTAKKKSDEPKEQVILDDNESLTCLECVSRIVEEKEYEPEGILFLRELYDHALVENSSDKEWIINAFFRAGLAFDAFDCRGYDVPLSRFLFGDFRIMDIFLLSKLSYCGKLFLNRDPTVFVPANMNISGKTVQDQFLAFLAPYNVCIEADKRERTLDIGAIYSFDLTDRTFCSVGFNIPIRSCSHLMTLDLVGPNPYDLGFERGNIETLLEEFRKLYIDTEDFFNRAVLCPKGLCFKERQHEIGLGNVSIFALFDLSPLFERINGFQLGVDLFFPTPHKPCKNDVWGIFLGEEAYQIGLSANFLYKSCRNYFNPSFGVGGRFSFKFESCLRIPKLKCNPQDERINVTDVEDLIVPVFQHYFVDPFAEYDTCVRYFADQAVCAEIKMGEEVFLSLGNYFYNVFKENFRLNIFYDFAYRSKDKICVKCAGRFNTCLLGEYTKLIKHQISWNLAYISKKDIQVNIGSRHVVAGKNHLKTHDVSVGIVAAF